MSSDTTYFAFLMLKEEAKSQLNNLHYAHPFIHIPIFNVYLHYLI